MRRQVPEAYASLEQLPSTTPQGQRIVYTNDVEHVLTPMEALEDVRQGVPVFWEVRVLGG